MKSFLADINQLDDELVDWNENVWMLMVSSAVVHRDSSITFKFTSGTEVTLQD